MKPLHLPLLCMGLLLLSCFASGQVITEKINTSSIFSKGKNRILLERNISYRNLSNYFDGDKTGRTNSFQLHADYSRFIIDGLAVGTKVDIISSGSHPINDFDVLGRTWSVAPHALYGTRVSAAVNIYGKAGVEFGSIKTINKTPSGSNTQKADLFGYNFTVGFPVSLKPNTNTCLTPYLGFRHHTYKYDDGKEKTNQLILGAQLEAYLFDNEIKCDKKAGQSFSKDKYDQGSSFIGYYSRASLAFGKNKTEYDLFPDVSEEKFTDGNLKVDYVYYIADYIGLGAGIGIMSGMQKSGDGDYKYTGSVFSFMPQVVAHIPTDNCFRNMFLQAEGKFGSQKTEYTFGSVTNTAKYNLSGFSVNVGYNHFFASHLAFTTIAGYQWRTAKEKDSDQKEEEKGFGLQGGIRFFF